jgi:hypothetical protein
MEQLMRKPIHLHATDAALFAIADDGTMWYMDHNRDEWEPVAPLPDTPVPSENPMMGDTPAPSPTLRVSAIDAKAMCGRMAVGRNENEDLQKTLDLYGWDAFRETYMSVLPPTGTVWFSSVKASLAAEYELTKDDYLRAGMAPPSGV